MLDEYARKERARFEREGEENVRRDIALGKYGGKRLAIAEGWLQERSRSRAAEMDARTDSSQAAHLEAATSAAASALSQADAAREANLISRASNTIAIVAAAISVAAMVVSVICASLTTK